MFFCLRVKDKQNKKHKILKYLPHKFFQIVLKVEEMRYVKQNTASNSTVLCMYLNM